ncbi:TPA: hypothetical protein JBC15_13270 [Legionella pneumophila subsp. pneumophila]|jgi:hypothetical protein|nr:hypothetical protein [Legionella pneumophila subsp. pneumophila]HAT9261612.1 hypothetical protein [Legionella pneumophila subsp. pneumophila]HAT9283435.1 hypothetical protein [Legionella pneumophila subsp. pneumophila]HAT9289497.1 hypothetical protein [Legionella pneumophila subsp. pneumophila]HAT9307361.1 hypothetical protein [Legionella pneumophila subsp. pneumophila]
MATGRVLQYVLLIGSFFISLPSVFSASCSVSPEQENRLLSMSYDNFDQAEDGWRRYAKLDCYHEIAILIDKYLEQNTNALLDWQVLGVTWHAGQLYAFNNEYELAKIRFEHSINQNEPENSPVLWNDYVYATIAFLNNDMFKLSLYRDKIADGPSVNGKKPNLDVVDNLIQYFGQPYSEAYRMHG